MAKARKFKAAGDTGVTVNVTDASGNNLPTRLEPGEPLETDDKAVIDALAGSPEVTEVKERKK